MTIFNLTHQEFLNQYGTARTNLVQDQAAKLAKEIEKNDVGTLHGATNRDHRRLVVTETLFEIIVKRHKRANRPGLQKQYDLKEISDATKWWLLNPVYHITEGALRLLWDHDHEGKASRFFKGDGNKYGQSNVIVKEHVYTTSVQKKRTFAKKFHSLRELAYYVSQRTILSFTAANEDVKLEKSEMSDKDNFFCRYDDIQLKTVPLAAKWWKYGRDSVMNKLAADAAKARLHGTSFDQWVESVIYF